MSEKFCYKYCPSKQIGNNQMICPKCGSAKIRRSVRKGLKEGLILRLALMAPYRCLDCGNKYFGFSLVRDFRRRKKYKGIPEYLGFHGDKKKKFTRVVMLTALSAALIILATMLVFRLSQGSAEPTQLP
jgi:hypothetical protein